MLKAPFPYFGGKSIVAAEVWARFGDVHHYVEPFAGSLAVLLGRPGDHERSTATVNDLDHYIANFWRALRADPDAVARHVDYPVIEADLIARHIWLVNEGRERIAHLEADPDAYDTQVAGWWAWGLSAWIGSSWCAGDGPWIAENGALVKRTGTGAGARRKLPHLGDAGKGVHRQLPHLGNAGQGVHRQLPHLGNAGKGVHRQLPHLGDAGKGVHRQQGAIYEYMAALADKLRQTRVCCGDWRRIVTNGALNYGRTVGVFLDPPYLATTGRKMALYSNDSHDIADDVREWAIANGDNPRYRIALCGYEGEHDMPDDWHMHAWKGRAAYKSANGDGNGRRHLERVWFSPHCLNTAGASGAQPHLLNGAHA